MMRRKVGCFIRSQRVKHEDNPFEKANSHIQFLETKGNTGLREQSKTKRRTRRNVKDEQINLISH